MRLPPASHHRGHAVTAPAAVTKVRRVMKARRPSTCPSCRGPVHVGQSIAKVTRPPGWIHTRCVESVRAVLTTTSTEEKP